MEYQLRREQLGDTDAIRHLTDAAFKETAHSSGKEAAIVDALRDADKLTISIVATLNSQVVGHVALSPVQIDGLHDGWYGLGPISVQPDLQKQGIGSALVWEGLRQLRDISAHGCVILGDPTYYHRFGFECDPRLRYLDAPAEYFMKLSLDGSSTAGIATFHDSFSP